MDESKKIIKLQKKIKILEGMIEANSLEIFENEEQLADQQVKLMFNAKLASIGEMASSIAHEVNNPICIIEGQLRRLEKHVEKGEKEQQLDLIGKIKKNTRRVIKIIHGLKHLSKISEKEDMKIINLNLFLKEFEEYNHVKVIDSNVDIKYPILPENEVWIHGKETALAQILTNLVNNSLDALDALDGVTGEKAFWIEVKLEISPGKVKLRVVDSGAGIDEKLVIKLFDPFFTTKSHEKGSGVGLNICKKLSHEIEGELSYELFNGHTSFLLELKAG
jgi:two-component system NtrC family sensor kinase